MRGIVLLVTFGLLVGCSARTAPQRFADQLAVETGDLVSRPLESVEADFATRILGKLALPIEILEDGSGTSVVIDIGTPRSVECFFFADELDLAAALIDYSKLAFEEFSSQLGAIEKTQVSEVEAGAIDGAPMFSVEWIYTVGGGNGHLKHRVASVADRSVYCRHLETGYRKTFARLFEEIVRNLRYPSTPRRKPFYESVVRVLFSKRPVGVERTAFYEHDEGDVRLERSSHLLLPVDGQTLMASDIVDVQFSTREGMLINAVHVQSENGGLTANLALDPSDNGWKVYGMLQEKEFASEFTGSRIHSMLGDGKAVRQLVQKGEAGASIELGSWLPEVSPAAVTTGVVKMKGKRDDGHYNVDVSVGPLLVRTIVDDQGETVAGQTKFGQLEFEMVQIFQRGRF